MKKTLTLTFEFDDGPEFDEETGLEHPTDAVAYAMDHVNEMASLGLSCRISFVEAKLDGEVLVDGSGYVSEEVKKREAQHRAFRKEVASHFC